MNEIGYFLACIRPSHEDTAVDGANSSTHTGKWMNGNPPVNCDNGDRGQQFVM